MMPSMVGQLMSFADVQYRQEELMRQFAESRGARSRRARRRATRATRATRNESTAAVGAAAAAAGPAGRTAASASAPVVPEQAAANSPTPVLDERLPVA